MTTLAFPYKPKPLKMLLAAAFFAGCGWLALHKAQSPHGGMVVEHAITLGVEGAGRVYWGMVVTSAVFVACGVAGFWNGLRSRNRLVLTDTTLSVPTWPWSSRGKDVPLAAITGLHDREISGQRMLTVYYRGGNVTINKSFLPSAEAYEDVLAVLDAVATGAGQDAAPVRLAPPPRRP